MEGLGVLPCKPTPHLFQIPPKIEPIFDLHTRQFKPSMVSFTKSRQNLSMSDSRLGFLLRNGRYSETIAALDEISRAGLKIRADTYAQLLDDCIELGLIDVGRELHARLEMVDGVQTFVETKLVGMHAKCGRLSDARKVFNEMLVRDLYAWSAIIGAYSREQRWGDVLELFGLMMEEGFLPDRLLIPKILQACGNHGDYETGRLVHSLAIRSGLCSSSRVCNALLSVYVKCGRFSSAREFFRKMDWRDTVSWNSIISGYCRRGESDEALKLLDVMCKEGIEPGLVTWNILISSYNQSGNCDAAMALMRKMESFGVVPDVFTWTTMISGLAQNNRTTQALELLREMIMAGVEPSGVTLTSAVSACSSLKSLENGKELHSLAIKKGHDSDVLVGNSLIHMYAKCGDLEAARVVFDSMVEKDVYTWNSMIGGYCQGGYCGKAYGLFMKMQESDIKPNVVTRNILLTGYIHNGDEDEAMDLFQKMVSGGSKNLDTSSWNSVISGYLQIGQKDNALRIFRQMQRLSVRPNSVTILTVLPACGNLVTAKKVKEIHALVLRRGLESNVSVANCLIDSYAKSGSIAYSRSVFSFTPVKDVITWNSLITANVIHGYPDEALGAFGEMKREGFPPNRGTLLSILLAYGLKKMVDKGRLEFSNMTEEYKILPSAEHCSAMVTLLGRSGKLLEALEFIETMEIERESAAWDALFTAARFHGNFPLAIQACEKMLELNPSSSILQHLVSQTHKPPANENPLKPMKKGTEKVKGCSLIEVKNTVHSFITGEKNPAVSLQQVKLHGQSAMVNIEEEERESVSGIHSEKLALAFALVGGSSKGQPIRIMKNFRICADCHNTFKFVSANHGYQIFLSDTKCLHHFKDGLCSCGDYW